MLIFIFTFICFLAFFFLLLLQLQFDVAQNLNKFKYARKLTIYFNITVISWTKKKNERELQIEGLQGKNFSYARKRLKYVGQFHIEIYV